MRLRRACGLAGVSLAAVGLAGFASAQENARFTADLAPVNAEAIGLSGSGTATFDIRDGQLTITVDGAGLAPDLVHIQHFHGFADGKDGTCPTADADTNGDGYVDLFETEPFAGTTMVPFHQELPDLAIPSETYPVADAAGATHYEKTVAAADLEQALVAAFGVSGLDLASRVVFIHGVPEATALPASVQSLHDVPAHVTLPVACGTIEAAQ